MIFRQLTGSGDWTFGKGIACYARDEQALELNIWTRLQSWKGDCFFALADHVDWLARLERNQLDNLTQELKTVLLATPGVVRINAFHVVFDPITRAVSITYNIDTVFGTGFANALSLAAGVPVGGGA